MPWCEGLPGSADSTRRGAGLEELQPFDGRGKRLAFPREMEAQTLPAGRRIGVEARARHPGDTHVRRLANRLGFSEQPDADKIEQDLMRLIPRRRWFGFSYVLIDHGRAICQAKQPRCDECPVERLCPSSRI